MSIIGSDDETGEFADIVAPSVITPLQTPPFFGRQAIPEAFAKTILDRAYGVTRCGGTHAEVGANPAMASKANDDGQMVEEITVHSTYNIEWLA
jgi:hypothetical protein